MTYGIELTQEQRVLMNPYIIHAPDHKKIEFIFNRVATAHEIDWKDILHISPGTSLGKRNIGKAKSLCVMLCYEYFHADYTRELFDLEYSGLQYYIHRAKEYADTFPSIASLMKSIRNDIKYNLPCN